MKDGANVMAFYGSLRKDMPLYNQFKNGLDYKFSAWIRGYQLFSLGDFPCAVKSENNSDKLLVEFFNVVDPFVAKQIDDIEIGYGYDREFVEVDGVKATIYLFKNAENYPRVLGGDWVEFFRVSR